MDTATARKLGMTEYELKCYSTLLKYGTLSGSEVSALSGVPEAKVYGALQKLEEKKLAVMISRRPMTFRGVDPKVGLKHVVDSKREELESAESELLDHLMRIKSQQVPENPQDRINVSVGGAGERVDIAAKLIDSSEKLVYGVSAFDFSPSQALKLVKARRKALRRNVDLKLITTSKKLESMETIHVYLKSGFSEIRFHPGLYGITFHVVDNRRVHLVLIDPRDKDNSLLVDLDSPVLSKLFKEYFLKVWKKAEPLSL